MHTKTRKLLLVLPGIFLAFLVLEIGLRIAGGLYRQRHGIHSNGRTGSIRILCLGESSTGGLWVEPNDSYPKQLERLLNEYYRTDRMETIIPFLMGQNSSQIANRVEDYLKAYHPRLVIVMAGVNNEWSFAENNFVLFLKGSGVDAWKVRLETLWDRLRVLKVARYVYLKYTKSDPPAALFSGEPEFETYPPEEWKWEFSRKHVQAFIDGWAYDMTKIIRKAKDHGATVLIMDYHINPIFLQADDVERIARKEGAAFLINDAVWHKQITQNNLTKGYVLQDGWHPNRQGYALLAKNVFDAIRRKNLLGMEGSR